MSSRKTTNSDAETAAFAARLGHRFADPRLLEQALTHRSFAQQNNERLEFLGDAVLGAVVADALFNRYDTEQESGLSLMRASLVRRDTLASIGRELELGRALMLGSAELRSGAHDRSSVLADALEAVLGAVYLDAGFEVAHALVLKLFENRLATVSVSKDAKTRLQELLQGRGEARPVYSVESVTGADHARQFMVRCTTADDAASATGTASSRRRAEQLAAAGVLEKLGESL